MKPGLLMLIALLSLSMLAADLSASAEIGRYAFTGGGGHAQAGIYMLEAAIGQPLADLDSAFGKELCAGFECAPQGGRIYLPLIKK